MTQSEVYELLEGEQQQGESFLQRICRERAFRIIGQERRALVEAMEQARPDHPALGRADRILDDMNRNLREWLENWPQGRAS
jgi:hypothetical protein